MRRANWFLECLARLAVLAGLAGALLASVPRLAADPIVFDFESGDLQGFEVIEGSFGKLLTSRAEFHHGQGPYNKQGTWFLSTLETPADKPSDGYTGVVESPFFVLTAAEVSFLVGGGGRGGTYVALCSADGRELLKAAGANAQKMQTVQWTVPAEWLGQPLFLRIVDRTTEGWCHITFDDFRAEGERVPVPADSDRSRRQRAAWLAARLQGADPDSVAAAIRHLAGRYPDYPGEPLTGELAAIRRQLGPLLSAPATAATDAELEEVAARLVDLRARALLAHPLLQRSPILFVARAQYAPDHHNTATLFQAGECNTSKFRGGSALKLLDLRSSTERVRVLYDAEAEGLVRDPDVSFDGSRVLFALRRGVQADSHIFEISADGTGLRQLTRAAGVSDIDPVYLPDGTIVFSSTREPKYCGCNMHIMANLFRMAGDGANVHQIGRSTLFEGHPAVLEDGRILYDRWEYVDRNFGDAQGLWTVNPDGTNHAVYWGNNTSSPGAVIDARPVPGTQRVVCVLTSCHDRPWGALAILDRRLGIDVTSRERTEPVVHVWPATARGSLGAGGFDSLKNVNPKYEDPWPLDDSFFLCARQTGTGEAMGIFLVDVFGNELLLHAEEPGCYDPMPLAARDLPRVVPSRRDPSAEAGFVYVANVYEGAAVSGVAPGSVRYLRVVESPPKKHWTVPAWGGQGVQRPAMNWHNFENKRVLGTVPVAADGSAYAEVPSDRFVYFQLLDERRKMVASMRTGTIVQAGERLGCVGCHEERRTAAGLASAPVPRAMTQAPAKLDGWFGDPRLFSYAQEVQPVWDRHCLGCHDYGKPGAAKLVLAGDKTLFFNVSYQDLHRHWNKPAGFIRTVGAGPAAVQQAYAWGAHASRLVTVLEAGHNKVRLTSEEMERIVTWLDLNAPYYPTYACAYPDSLTGRCPLTNDEVARLSALTGKPLAKFAQFHSNPGAMVTFDRPELSPCLESIRGNPEALQEALSLIRAGAERLQTTPRADMPGFVPCERDRQREEKYALRQRIEEQSRRALLEGLRVYDDGPVAAAPVP